MLYISIGQYKTLGERKKDLDHTYKATFPWRGCLFLSLIYNTVTLLLLKTAPPSPPADTGSGRNDIESKEQNQTIYHLCMPLKWMLHIYTTVCQILNVLGLFQNKSNVLFRSGNLDQLRNAIL